MSIFVTKSDPDWRAFLHRSREERNRLKDRKDSLLPPAIPQPPQVVSQVFEQMVKEMVGSTDRIIVKKQLRKQRLAFREVDFMLELSDRYIIGEVKCRLKLGESRMVNSFNQVNSVKQLIGHDAGKPVQVCAVFIGRNPNNPNLWRSISPELVANNERIRLDADALFALGLEKGYFTDPNYLQTAIDFKYSPHNVPKENPVAIFNPLPLATIGDLLHIHT